MTRQAVSNRGGLASATITEIEKGQKEEPRWPTIRRLAKGLGVTTVDLILLGLELAPGAAGDRLRQQDLNLQKALAKGAGLHAHRSADPSTVGDGAESPGDGQ
jgi:transcriptional regulator with XRE-family HTH domain